MPDYSVDMINFVVDQKPNEFVNSFNAQMQQKVTDIITGNKYLKYTDLKQRMVKPLFKSMPL